MSRGTTAPRRRPDMERVYGPDFVRAAVSCGYDRAQAENAWRYLVQADKRARYTTAAALAEYLVKGRLRAVIMGGPQQFNRIPRLWPIMSNAASKFI